MHFWVREEMKSGEGEHSDEQHGLSKGPGGGIVLPSATGWQCGREVPDDEITEADFLLADKSQFQNRGIGDRQ
jgi:hypothetical protein